MCPTAGYRDATDRGVPRRDDDGRRKAEPVQRFAGRCAALTDFLYAGFLGFVAGFVPVYLGLVPLWYFRGLSDTWRAVLVSFSAGILLFLFADVTHEGVELANGPGSSPFLFAIGLVLGLAGPLLVSRRGGKRNVEGPETAPRASLSQAGGAKLFTAYTMSLGIGLHNFGEGLAIGASYAAGALGLTTLLVVGFFLHNSTEGLGLTAPIATKQTGFRDPLLLGFFAGFPTILGSMIGAVGYSTAVGALFFAAAAGALLYVIVELLKLVAPHRTRGLFAGAVLGVLVMYFTGLLVPLG